MARYRALLLAVMVALLAPSTAVATDAPAGTTVSWFLTGARTSMPEFGLQNVLTMGPALANTDSQARFSAVTGGLPTGQGTVQEVRWYWDGTTAMDMEVTADARAVLYLEASVQASAQAKITLRALAPDGSAATIAQQTRAISVGSATTTSQSFDLAARGQVLPEGATLELTVAIEGASLATVLRYDSNEFPSALEGLATRPLDSDGDGIPDSLERIAGTDPLDNRDPGDGAFDSDGDGLPDDGERTFGTNPNVADSDGDGFGDGAEVRLGTDPLDPSDTPPDRDGDRLADGFEQRAGTSADARDTNGNGIDDCDEDPDGDGLSNCQEQSWGTDPLLADTDGDGIDDGAEVAQGTDPTLHRSPPSPRVRQIAEVIAGGVFLAAGLGLAIVGLTRRHAL